MKNCKAIIFDLGGVILNIDYILTIAAFENLEVKHCEILLKTVKILTRLFLYLLLFDNPICQFILYTFILYTFIIPRDVMWVNLN